MSDYITLKDFLEQNLREEGKIENVINSVVVKMMGPEYKHNWIEIRVKQLEKFMADPKLEKSNFPPFYAWSDDYIYYRKLIELPPRTGEDVIRSVPRDKDFLKDV